MSENDSDLGAFLAGFVIGGLVGAAAALILAPQSGEQTRSQIVNRGTALRDAGGDRLQSAQETARQRAEAYRSQAQAATEQVREQARIVLDEGRSRLEETKARLGSQEEADTGANGTGTDAEGTAQE